MIPSDDDLPMRNGIEKCEDLCKCGANLRLHTHVFGIKEGNPKVRFYVDCPGCGITSGWHDSPDEAIEDFDKCMNAPEPAPEPEALEDPEASRESTESAAVSEASAA